MKKILILASNPDKDLDLGYEIHALKDIIEDSENLQEFDVIPYVVGTSQEILDRAAYLFAVGFYEALGYGENIERCYELGCNAIEIRLNKAQLVPRENLATSRKFEVINEEGRKH